MPQHWRNFISHTIWDSQHNEGNWFDIAYPIFNIVEAVCWLCVAAFFFRRSLQNQKSPLEAAYAGLWFLFGLTDLREAYCVFKAKTSGRQSQSRSD